MFKKAQLRLFATITAILLAIFVAVLGSVNLITEAVIEKQSNDILAQIAADVEYDDSTGEFMYYGKMDNRDPRRDDHFEEPPSKPDGQPGTDEPKTTEESTAPETTVPEETTGQPQTQNGGQGTPDPPVTQPQTTSPEKPTDAPPASETQPQVTEPAITEPSEQPTEPTLPWGGEEPGGGERPTRPNGGEDPWGGQNPWGGEDPWKNWGGEDPWKNWGGQNPWGGGGQWPYQFESGNNKDDDDDDADDYGDIMQTAFFSDEEGGIVALANTETQPASNSSRNGSDREGFQRKSGNSVPKSLGTIDFFVVMADEEGNYLATLNNDELSAETAQAYITEILKVGSDTGRINNYQYCKTGKSNGTLFVFTDKSAEMDMLSKLNRTTVIIGSISVILLSAAAFFLSRQIMKPLKLAFERQKQFISDASHELKTPLTVISANADVLTDEIGSNKWLTYIKAQTDRMNVLVNDLLNLTRLENNTSSFIRTDFNLSQAITNTALPFECQAFETNKKFIVDVEDGITINGSEQHVKQMAAIFIDNALKYSNDGGIVRVMLKKQGDKGVLTVYNTGQGIKESEREKIFERFYRSDESRNRATGGYGLGLAIAKSIIDKHKFKVQVEGTEGRNVSFIVTM